MNITDFLLARIAEDEAVANHLRRPSKGDPWGWQPKPHPLTTCRHGSSQVHVNPARVLAECEAKRRIVGLHQSTPVLDHYEFDCTCGFSDHRRSECLGCGATTYDEGEFERPYAPCPELRVLAAVYADHPDYREEWRP